MGPHGNSAKKKPNGARSSAGHATGALTPPMRNDKAPRDARDASHSDDDGGASPSTPARSSQAPLAAPAADASSSGAGLGMKTDTVQTRPPKAAACSTVPLISVVEAYEAAVNDLGDASSSPDLLCALGLHPVGSGAIYDAAHVLLLTSPQDVALQPLEGSATVVDPATALGAAMAVRSAVLADEDQHSWMGSVTALACGHTACSVCVASAGATVKCHCGVLTAVPTNATAAAAQGNKDSGNNGSGSGIRDAVALLPTHAAATAWARHLLSVAFRSALRQAEAAASSQAAPSHCGTSQGTSQGAAVAAGAPRPLCGYCEEAPEVVHCVECNFGLCETCRDTVHAKGRFKTHTLTPSASGVPQDPPQQQHQNASSRRSAAGHSAAPAFAPAPTTTCAEHPSYPLELYCRKCEACICLRCHYSGPHKGHETTPLGDLLGAIRAELQQQESKIRDGAAVWQAVWDRLGKAAATLSNEAETIRAAVRGQFAAARSLLDEAEAQSLLEADAYLRARRAAVSEDVDDACRLALRLRGAGVGMRLALGGEANATTSNGGNNSNSTVAATTLLKYHGAITRQSTAIVASDAHISAAVHAGAAKYSAALEAACAAWEDLRHVAVCSSEPTSSSAAAAALRLAVSHALAAVTAKSGGHFVSSSRDASERVLDTTLAALTTTPRPKSPSAMGRHANHHQQHLQQHHQQPTRSSSDMTLGRLLQEAEMGAGSSHTKQQQQQQLQKQQPAPLQRAVAPPAVVTAPLLESVDPPSHFGFATQEPTVNLFGGGSRGAATAMHLQALTAQWGLTQQPQQPPAAASSSGRGSGWQPTATDAPPPKAHRVELIPPALEQQQQPPSGVTLSPPRAAAPAAAVGPKAAMAAARNAATLNFGPRKGNKGGGNGSGGVPSPQTNAPANGGAGGFQLHI